MYEHRRRPMTPFQERLGRMTVQVMAGMNNVAYRLSDGRVGGHVPSGAPICLLSTTGRRSGRTRTVPVLFLWDDDDMVIVASNGGSSQPPQWYLNLRAQPEVDVGVDDWRQVRHGRTADGEERAEHWPRFLDAYLHFAHYETRTDREMPIVILEATGERQPSRPTRSRQA